MIELQEFELNGWKEIASVVGMSVRSAQSTFHSDVESIRRQITNRRKFLLAELAK